MNYVLCDIVVLGKEFDEWGRGIVLLFFNEEQYKKFCLQEFFGLLVIIIYGIDVDGFIQKQIVEGMKLFNKIILFMFIIGDIFNWVVFVL